MTYDKEMLQNIFAEQTALIEPKVGSVDNIKKVRLTVSSDSVLGNASTIDPLVQTMQKLNIPVNLNRDTYIDLSYGRDVPEWGPKLEAQLPVELQYGAKCIIETPARTRIVR